MIWAALGLALIAPVLLSLASPLLQWRDATYIAAALAGVLGLSLMALQPLLAAGLLPGLAAASARRVHRGIGLGLVALMVAHVGGLWLTSPPDVIDVFLLRSPAPFSTWGLFALVALVAAACLAGVRRRFRGRLIIWRRAHTALAGAALAGTIVHAILIQGTMEPLSKIALSGLAIVFLVTALRRLRTWTGGGR